MIGKITLSITKPKSKKSEYYQTPLLFDANSADIRYAYPIREEAIVINMGGEILEIDYDKHVWEALSNRFSPKQNFSGFAKPTEHKPKRGGNK